jgi:hypothetical protein
MEFAEERINQYDELATSLSGFEDGEELINYILDAVADEIEAQSDTTQSKELNEDTVEERLEDLGYLG